MLQTDLSLPYLYKEAKNTTKPKLLLLLHGYGSNEADLFAFADELPEDLFVISVRAPSALSFGGFAWYDINFMDSKKFNNLDQAKASIANIRRFIAECIVKHKLNDEDISLCGFSQGAILSYALSLQNPQNIKNVLCLSGYPALDIIGQELNKDYTNLNFFISHGSEDATIPVEWARKGPDLLSKLDIKHTYKEYRSGHGVVPQNFYDMRTWLVENIKD